MIAFRPCRRCSEHAALYVGLCAACQRASSGDGPPATKVLPLSDWLDLGTSGRGDRYIQIGPHDPTGRHRPFLIDREALLAQGAFRVLFRVERGRVVAAPIRGGT